MMAGRVEVVDRDRPEEGRDDANRDLLLVEGDLGSSSATEPQHIRLRAPHTRREE